MTITSGGEADAPATLREYGLIRIFLGAVQRLRHSDLEGVVRIAGEIALLDETGQDPFPDPLLESLRSLVGSDAAGYSEVDRVGERVLAQATVGDDSGDDPGEEVFWALRHEWPSCSYEDRTLDFGAHKLSDFVTTRQLRRLQVYHDLLRPWRVEHEIGVGLPAELTHTKLFLFVNGPGRDDFGERERTILTLLRPHLAVRYERVQLRLRTEAALAALDTTDEPLVLLNGDGSVDFATTRARRLLSSYGLELRDVSNGGPLRLRSVCANVMLLEERRPLGLTLREREILALVAEGKTNAQVAADLWIAPATVGKHLENAYAKLGVTSRTAAVRMVRNHEIVDPAERRHA